MKLKAVYNLSLFLAFCLLIFIPGCDVEYLEYENDDSYELLENGMLAPADINGEGGSKPVPEPGTLTGFYMDAQPPETQPPLEIFVSDGLPEEFDINRIDDGKWHFMAVVYNNGVMQTFIDNFPGEKIDTGSRRIQNNDVPITIGIASDRESYQYLGVVDEVAIFNVALSRNAMDSMYNDGIRRTGGAKSSLVLHLPLDEGKGIFTADASGINKGINEEDRIIIIGDAQWTDGWKGKAVEIVQDSYILVPHNDAYNFEDQLTLMAWIKTETIPEISRVIAKTDLSGSPLPVPPIPHDQGGGGTQ